MRNAVAAEAVGDEALWLVLQPGEQALEEALGGRGVPSILNQDVEHHPMPVDGTPEIVQLAFNLQKDLIQVPGIVGLRSAPAELAGKLATKDEAPLPDTLVTDDDAALGKDQLNVSEAQAEKGYSQTAWRMISAGKR